GPNVWQTTMVFAEGTRRYTHTPRLSLLDYNGTGDYALEYVLDDAIPPQVVQIGAVTPDPRTTALDSVNVQLSEPIDLSTFDWHDVMLQRNGQSVPLSPVVSVALVPATTSTYAVSGLAAFTAADGAYQITVAGAGIEDFGAND